MKSQSDNCSGVSEYRVARHVCRLAVFLLLGVAGTVARADAAEAEGPGKGPFPLAETLGPKVEILDYDNGDVSPWAEFFAFDSPDHPKIVRLRKEHKLDELIKDTKTDLERALAFKRWVAGTLEFGTPSPEVFSDWSAVALMEQVKRGQRVWCGQAAMVFQQACIAVGLPARFIELGRTYTPANHFTTEVYLREYGKWAVVDCTPLRDFDLYYTVDGIPQSALEMHRHLVDGRMDRVIEVHPDRSHPVQGTKGPAWCFYYVRWLTRCDVVTHTPRFIDLEHTFDRTFGTVEWTDDKTVPWEQSKHSIWWVRNVRMSAWNTSNPEVANWKPSDRVKIVLAPGPENRLFCQLWNADLDFDHYQARIDGGPWEDLPKTNTTDTSGKRYGWGLKRFSMLAAPGVHEARVRLVRRDGSTGPASFVSFRVD